jgi:S1-C subfamily serine protease
MTSVASSKIPPNQQPKPEDYDYDLERALASVVNLHSLVAADAFTAETLGTERGGNGVVIRDAIVLTIGYLIMEAESIWLTTHEGKVVPGHVLAYDQETGFGLVQALGSLDTPSLPLGGSAAAPVGTQVVLAGAGGRQHSVAARIVAKQEFAGNWEYVLEEAIFTAPAHPNWGGTALIGPGGDVLGIGSLQVQQTSERGSAVHLNMVVPIDLLHPILDDLVKLGRPNHPPRPWLGIYAADIEDKIIIVGVAERCPAAKADVRPGDVIMGVAGAPVSDLPALFRRIWSLGHAGVTVPLLISREGRTFELHVRSGDRNRFLKGPSVH